jgi:hypothetical protein
MPFDTKYRIKVMMRIYIFSLVILFSSNIIAQHIDELINTPFGPTIKSNVHFVGKNYHINNNVFSTQIIQNNTSTINKEYYGMLQNKSLGLNALGDSRVDGWITWAYCQVYVLNPNVTYFSSEYLVPDQPKKYSDQLLYLFSGLMGVNGIIQPVLQWGVSPAGGGDYWSICNWYVSSNGQFFYDSLIKVNTGTRLKSVIKLTATSDSLFCYNSSFEGYPGLQVDNISQLMIPSIALEGYNVQGCDEYPSDEKIKINNIQILHDSIYPPLKWTNYNKFSDCGQFTRIVNSRADYGQIDIHFHTPSAIDGFHEIHIYPNPVENILHISPDYLENPLKLYADKTISKCKIELYNSLGKLMQDTFYENLDYEFNIDMRNLPSGLYIIRFSYNNATHSFKIIKN